MKITSRIPLLFLWSVIALLIIQCSKQSADSEIVLHRFPDGSPREVWIMSGDDKSRVEIIYYDNGQKQRERRMLDDLPDGPWLEWHRNGQMKYNKNYRKGNLDGEQSGWFMTGEPLYQSTFKDGELITRTTWDIRGNVVSKE